jgi:hypothetical protein
MEWVSYRAVQIWESLIDEVETSSSYDSVAIRNRDWTKASQTKVQAAHIIFRASRIGVLVLHKRVEVSRSEIMAFSNKIEAFNVD